MTNHYEEITLNSIIYFIEHGYNYCNDVYNILYLFDLQHYKETVGIKSTNQSYKIFEDHPRPITFETNLLVGKYWNTFDIIFRRLHIYYEFKTKQKFNSLYFSKRQLRILKEVVTHYSDTDWFKMWESTWLSVLFENKDRQPIVTDDMWNELCGFTEEQIMDIEENNNDKKILEEIFKNG